MSETKPATREPTSFEKFREFTRKLVAVPKAEIDKQARYWRQRRRRKRA